MRNIGFIWITLFLLPGLLHAQDEMYDLADDAYLSNNFRQAYSLFQEAGEWFQQQEMYGKYAHCSLRMADCLIRQGQFQDAAVLSSNIQQYVSEVLPENSLLLADSYRLYGECQLNFGKNQEALNSLKQSESYYGNSPSLPLAECFNLLGLIYMNNQNLDFAEQYHRQALEIRKNILDESSPTLADSYNNMALLKMESDPVEATDYFEQALGIYEKSYGTLHPKVGYVLLNLSKVRASVGWYGEADAYYEKSMYIWNNLFDGDHPSKAFSNLIHGQNLQMQGKLTEALRYFENALQLYIRLFGEKHTEVANTYFLIGEVHQQMSDFKDALLSYQQAIYANLPNQKFTHVNAIPETKNFLNADYLLRDLLAKAKILEAIHFEKSLKPKDIRVAIQTYQQADSLVSTIRSFRQTESDKIRLGEQANLIYDNGIRLSLYLANQPMFFKNYYETAFNFCERSKAAVLLAAIQDSEAKTFAGIPEDLTGKEDSLKNEIAYLRQQVAQDSKNSLWHQQLFNAERSYSTLISKFESEYPEYFQLKHTTSLADIPSIQERLTPDQAMLSYFESSESWYVFRIHKKQMVVSEIPKPDNWEKQANGFRNSLFYRIRETREKLAGELYKTFIPDIPKETRHVIILPAGKLQLIPFEALRKQETNQYLVENWAVSYSYAATLWLNASHPSKTAGDASLLAVAPVNFSSHQIPFSELIGTEKEVNDLKYLFIGRNMAVEKLTRLQATEHAFKSIDLTNYRYIHLATHGEVNIDKPALSRIILKKDTLQDGFLYTGEVYGLKLDADLVTLSACETGIGKLATGEGILGLSRALVYAGGKNLLVSQWKVSDESTALLMHTFYDSHLGGSESRSFSHALQATKINMIRSDAYNDPYFWAPFILIGK